MITHSLQQRNDDLVLDIEGGLGFDEVECVG